MNDMLNVWMIGQTTKEKAAEPNSANHAGRNTFLRISGSSKFSLPL